jgi:type IV pilus assembly protein PilM
MRVLVVAVRRDTVEHLLAAAKKAGLTPELVDLSAFAIVRALYAPPAAPAAQAEQYPGGEAVQQPADGNGHGSDLYGAGTIYCYVGGMTNLAIATGTTCVFNRVLPNGVESMAAALAERKGLTLDHSRQWLRHVGLEGDVEQVDGDQEIVQEARQVLVHGVRRIGDEMRLSIEYYGTAVPDARPVEQVILAGPGMAIAGFAQMLESELGLSVRTRSLGQVEVMPGVLDGVDGTQLTVAAGLALDEVTA